MPPMSPADTMIWKFVLAVAATTVTLMILAVIERALGNTPTDPTDMAVRDD